MLWEKPGAHKKFGRVESRELCTMRQRDHSYLLHRCVFGRPLMHDVELPTCAQQSRKFVHSRVIGVDC